jgi:hypothetical protein
MTFGTLSDQVAALAASQYAHPVPIYNAVHPDPALPGGYEWFEVRLDKFIFPQSKNFDRVL